MRASRAPHAAVLGAAALGVLVAGAVLAVEEVALTLERIEGGSWSARGATVDVQLGGGGLLANLHIREVRLPGFDQPLRDVSIQCAALEISVAAYRCRRAALRFVAPQLGQQSVTADLRYERRSGAVDLDVHGLRVGQGAGAARLALRRERWTAGVTLNGAQVQALVNLAKTYARVEPPIAADSGLVSMTASISGRNGQVERAALTAQIEQLTSNNVSGSIATDKLSAEVRTELEQSDSGWRFALEMRSRKGQAYVQPIFLDLGVHSLAFTARGALSPAMQLTVDAFSVDHADVLQAHGRSVLDFEQEQPLRALDLQLNALQFPGAYEAYLQPWLLDTSFKAMQTRGAVSGRVQIKDSAPHSADLSFDAVTFDDGEGRLGLRDLTGRWAWRDEDASDNDVDQTREAAGMLDSDLRFGGGSILGLEIGASRVRFATQGRSFRLLAPTRIPLLDGAINLESFRVRSAGTPKVGFLVDARIEPISVERLCKAFGWPEFGGQVSGEISKLRMREGVVTLGATLQAAVFDGRVSISDLRLEEPFGEWPRLHATIELDGLDLELVTRAFSFGRITGRLSGSIRDLELFNWSPVAFDARFYTPPNDRSRRRISQRAVQNIGNIGGGGAGVTAALSSGFLRFFDDFNYDQLGLSCRLRNDVCEMGGVGAAPNGGYYLVKGKGVPRIDVIGNARRVDWPRLVQQLIAITESEGPVVQ